ncbi:hypothetical protein GQ457_06G008910 [Hibiscus cannabinus]
MNQESGNKNQESGNRKQKSEKNRNQEKSRCSTGRIHTSKADQGSVLSTGLPTLYGGARTGNNRSTYGNRVGRAGLSG